MKTWVLLAALALSPAAAFAEDGRDRAPLAGPASEQVRVGLLQEIEAYRAALPPQTESGSPDVMERLNEIKAAAAAAETAAALAKTRADFDIFRIVVLRRQVAVQRVEAQAASVRALSMGAQTAPREWGGYFDGSSSVNGGAVAAETPLAANDPARYAKVRRIVISSGAQPRIVDTAIKEALRQGVDPTLVLSLIWQESKFKPWATSPGGARGLMQIMPGTGRDMGVSNAGMLYDVQTNLRAGIKYVRWAADYLKLDVNLQDVTKVPVNKLKALLASYNAGVGNVTKWLRRQGQDLTRIPFNETRNYVRVISNRLAGLVEFLGW